MVERNRLHNPRTSASSWKEKHKTFHPEGPQGVSFMRGQGQYVIRYNEIFGDSTHHFNDSMGAYHNFSYDGFPNRDSDIYGNYIAYVWDDGLEIEGADMNVRVWGNFALSSRSLGYDKGQVLPNFTDGFGGSAPDMGAQEAETPLLRFGVKARQ